MIGERICVRGGERGELGKGKGGFYFIFRECLRELCNFAN